jgi:hypothetical protein
LDSRILNQTIEEYERQAYAKDDGNEVLNDMLRSWFDKTIKGSRFQQVA